MMKRINYLTFLVALSLGLVTLAPVLVSAQVNATGAVNTNAAVTAPGATALTVILREATSRARALVKPICPAFEAE